MSETKFDVVLKKEYKTLSRDEPTIGLVMMVKNEKKRLHVTLDSVVGHVDCMIVFDTGSTDNTIELFEKHCEKHKINLYLIKGEFVDFSTSRNVVLDYADTIDVHFLLLMDCNDELQGGDKLRVFAKNQLKGECTGYLTCQHWWSGQYDKYFNMRFLRNRKGWRYRGRVHEWLKDTSSSTDSPSFVVIRMTDNIILYQDRTQDDDKTGKRFKRDRDLLLQDHKDNPEEPRTLFYLAQTCSCMGNHEESFYFYKLRSLLEGFQEEKFHAFLRAGDLSAMMKHDWHDTMSWYMKAAEHSNRAEPLIKIAKHYIDQKKWFLGYSFAKMSCQLPYPVECILFVDKRAYDYQRWHQLGIVAYYAGMYAEGKAACQKAVQEAVNKELDERNLKFYLDKEKEIEEKKQAAGVIGSTTPAAPVITKKQFLEETIERLKKENPNRSAKQLKMKAALLWKRRKK
jgi:glycosyltransferase involved in cell wall biosynthesis